jgi:outer membrane protein insertion porin family
MTGAGFENLVWLTPEELASSLHKAAPLFHGQLPDAGDQIDAITNGLQAALATKGVNAELTHETLQPSLTQPIRTIEFRVENPVVRVHAITLQGGVPELGAATAKTTDKLRGSRYSEGSDSANTLHAILAAYFDAGYLNAHLTGVQHVLVQNTPTDATIDLTATIDPGQPYKVAALAYDGTPLVARDAVMGAAKLHPGDIASARLLLETLAPIDTAYRRQGYMDVLVDPGAALDPAAHTVSYTVRVVPGAQYHLRSIKPFNLSDEARKDFDANWQLKPGDLYDSMYVADFMKHNLAMHALAGYSAAYEAVADPETHQVDLSINFVRIGR